MNATLAKDVFDETLERARQGVLNQPDCIVIHPALYRHLDRILQVIRLFEKFVKARNEAYQWKRRLKHLSKRGKQRAWVRYCHQRAEQEVPPV